MTSHSVAKRLGRYEIVKRLAQGGMADVLLARTVGIEGFERHVVLKRIRAEAAHDERFVAMFLDEARLAASLHHHNIVQVNDIGEEDGEYFFTMEYVHGEDTRALLARLSDTEKLLPLEHVLGIVCAAAAGLHHAHEQRGQGGVPLDIVHRDVSPANILIGYDGGVKMADFGIAKAAHRTIETKSGTLKGKVAYMSPEQCVGEAVDRRSDVFSLGIVLYELLTVRRLFKGDNDFMTMTAIVLGYIPPPSTYRPNLPSELEEIVLKALANRPEDRYATADELRLALEKLANRLQLSMSSTALGDYMKQVFGTRPEPWADEVSPAVVGIDFDGSLSGVVRVPIEAMPAVETMRLAALGSQPSLETLRADSQPSEIIELRPRADTQASTGEWPTTQVGIASVALADLVDPDPEARWPAVVEPIVLPVIQPVAVPRRRARTILGLLALLASACAFAVAIWMPRAETPPPPLPRIIVAPPVVVSPAVVVTPPAVAPPEIAPPNGSATKPATSTPARTPKPKKKQWNRSSLFLE